MSCYGNIDPSLDVNNDLGDYRHNKEDKTSPDFLVEKRGDADSCVGMSAPVGRPVPGS